LHFSGKKTERKHATGNECQWLHMYVLHTCALASVRKPVCASCWVGVCVHTHACVRLSELCTLLLTPSTAILQYGVIYGDFNF